jgi:hypothetical protein
MSTAHDTPVNGAEPGQRPMAEFWIAYFEQASGQARTVLDAVQEVSDPAALRRQWFTALAEGLDNAMRTPAFLESLRRNFEMLTQLKGTTEDVVRDVARATGIPRVNDISGLFERLRIGQDALLARLTAIEERLIALEQNWENHH